MNDQDKLREELLSIIKGSPDTWFSVSYLLKYNPDGTLSMDMMQCVKTDVEVE